MDESRAGRYERITAQLGGLLADRSAGLVAAMATVAALLHAKMPHHSWTGFYFVASPNELHVGPYQGPLACQVLRGRGVCLRAARTRSPIVVRDVATDPDHFACDQRSRSEIALPLLHGDHAVAVLDIDSTQLGTFDESDVPPLLRILSLLSPYVEANGGR